MGSRLPSGFALGSAGIAALPQLATRLNPTAVALPASAGLPTRPPRSSTRAAAQPPPAVFGYHELFHALTPVAVACQYVAIAFFVIRSG